QGFTQLTDFHVDFAYRRIGDGSDRLDGRLHALDVAAVVGAPDVDQVGKSAIDLALVVGDAGGEIGVAPVRLHQRPVDVVAECGGAKQRLFAILPVFDRGALGRRQAPLIDIAGPPQRRDRLCDLVAPTFDQRTLRGKD